MTLVELTPTILTLLVGWFSIEGLRFFTTLGYNKFIRKQDSKAKKNETEYSEYNHVEQIAKQSAESLISMNATLLGIVQESASKSKQIDDLSSSINDLTISNNKLKFLHRKEKQVVEKLTKFTIKLVDYLETVCDCEPDEEIKQLKHEIRSAKD